MGPHGVKTLSPDGDLASVVAQPDGRILTAGDGTRRNVVYRLRGSLRPPTCGGKRATIVGTHAPDKLVGTARPDVIAGLRGDDTITGLGRGDLVCGGHGDDHLYGGRGHDHLYGGPGHDQLHGGPGRDVLIP
jgi:Ca2+-binding RTX toxin-like protein